jgi:hypothetical protein
MDLVFVVVVRALVHVVIDWLFGWLFGRRSFA